MYIPLSRHTRPCSRKSWTGPGPRWPRCLDTEKLRSIRCYGASPSPPAIAACSATETHDSGPEAEASSYNSKTYQTHLVQPAPATRSTRVWWWCTRRGGWGRRGQLRRRRRGKLNRGAAACFRSSRARGTAKTAPRVAQTNKSTTCSKRDGTLKH